MSNDPYLPSRLAHELFPDHVTEEFWNRCRNHELAFQQCSRCGAFRNPPVPICHECSSTEYRWTNVSGDGTVYSYTIVTHPTADFLAEYLPFNVSLIEFPDAPGVRLVSNVIDASPNELAIDMHVRLVWQDLDTGVTLPRFVKA